MSYVTNEILKARKITDYLASKGIQPVGHEVNGKFRYKCPLHKGDNTPSFMVYTNGEFENYFCYGCKSKYTIIHLYKALEQVGIKEAITALSNGLNLNIDSEIDYIIREIENDLSISNMFSPVDLNILISRQIYDFLKMVEDNPEDVDRCEKIFQIVDEMLEKAEMDNLYSTYESLLDVLVERKKQFDTQKEHILCG